MQNYANEDAIRLQFSSGIFHYNLIQSNRVIGVTCNYGYSSALSGMQMIHYMLVILCKCTMWCFNNSRKTHWVRGYPVGLEQGTDIRVCVFKMRLENFQDSECRQLTLAVCSSYTLWIFDEFWSYTLFRSSPSIRWGKAAFGRRFQNNKTNCCFCSSVASWHVHFLCLHLYPARFDQWLQIWQAVRKQWIGGGGDKFLCSHVQQTFLKDYVTDICLDRVKVLQMLGGESVSRTSSFISILGGKLILNCYMAGYMSWHLALLAHMHTETHTCADTHSAICLVHDLNKDIHPPSFPPLPHALSLSHSLRLHCVCLPACTTLSKNIIPQKNGNTKETWAQSYKRTDTTDNTSSHPFPPIPPNQPP